MKRSVSIVEARRALGRLAEEVRRTGQVVVLTRRGRAVARIAPEPTELVTSSRAVRDTFAPVRGTVQMNCSFAELQRAIQRLRSEFARNLEHRAASPPGRGTRRRG